MIIYQNFEIEEGIFETYKDVIDLIISSETIDTQEQKEYWINAIGKMNEGEIGNLRMILTEERTKLDEINKKKIEKDQAIEMDSNRQIEQERRNIILESKKIDIKKEEEEDRNAENSNLDDLISQI